MNNRIRFIYKAATVLILPLILLSGCNAVLQDILPKKIDVEKESEKIYQEYLESISGRQDELESGEITIGDITMKHYFEKIGDPDENGYPLYIALRGGGVNTMEIVEEQYEVMQYYYTNVINSGLYIVPRCFIGNHDEHFRPESFLFYDRMIEDAIAFYNADPNRIYIIGFSSGGNGVYQIAPRMADRFAAANTSAGYPFSIRVGNLYNLPLCIQMGENDSNSDRNKSAAIYDGLLNDAAKEYGGGYIHTTYIHSGGTHNEFWDDRNTYEQPVYTGDEVANWLEDPDGAEVTYANTCAVEWLRQYVRDPYPERIVWDTDVSAGLRRSQAFYWLDRDGALSHNHIVASYSKDDNSVTIEECDAAYGTLKVYLNPQMLDVYHEVNVEILGTKYAVKPYVSSQIMKSTLFARGDRDYMFTSEIDISFDSDGKVKEVKAAEESVIDYSLTDDSPLYYWDDYGLFYADESLFGLTLEELEEKLGQDLPHYKQRKYRLGTLSYTYIDDPSGQRVVFAFQNRRCAVIYSEKEGTITPELTEADKKYIGDYADGILCLHYIQNEDDEGTSYVRQYYEWRYYELTEDMYAKLSI